MKTIITLAILALAAWLATGQTRALIRRLALADRQDEPYAASWWVQEIHCAAPRRFRDRIGRAVALRFA